MRLVHDAGSLRLRSKPAGQAVWWLLALNLSGRELHPLDRLYGAAGLAPEFGLSGQLFRNAPCAILANVYAAVSAAARKKHGL